jgi:hypothetical protein
MAALSRGDLGAALSRAHEGVKTARALGAHRTELIALLLRMLLHSELSARSLAEQDLSVAESLSDRIGGRFFNPPLGSARGWIELETGDPNRAVRIFADSRGEAEGRLLFRLLCGRFEISAWDDAQDATRLRDAGKWLMDSARGSSPPHEALATWAIARADLMDGQNRAALKRAWSALRIAQKVNDLPVAWRACSLVVSASQTIGDADATADAQRRGSEIVRSVVSSLGDDGLRDLFLARPDVATLLPAADC